MTGRAPLVALRSVRGYYIILRPDGERGFRCVWCGCLSWHPKDVQYRYCAGCHGFYEDAGWSVPSCSE